MRCPVTFFSYLFLTPFSFSFHLNTEHICAGIHVYVTPLLDVCVHLRL